MGKHRTKLQQRTGIQNTLEAYRRFDYDYIPFGKYTVPSASYPYRTRGLGRVAEAIIRGVLCVIGPLIIKVAYGCRIEGKEHLRALKRQKQGAICVSNHVAILDTLFVRHAIGNFHTYFTMAAQNNKRGIGGWFIRHAGMWAFSSDRTAVRQLLGEMSARLDEGDIVHFYAEQAMWINYQKPRPMKEGAFYYAVRNDVPVLPVFFTFDVNRRGHMKKLVVHILPPVYPDKALGRKECAQDLRLRAQNAWRECYEQTYHKPLSYLPDRRTGEKRLQETENE